MVSQLPDYMWLDAKDVVGDTIRAMSADNVKPVVIPGRQYKFMVFASRYLPWLAAILTKRSEKYYRVTD
jgi:hypothetical protein